MLDQGLTALVVGKASFYMSSYSHLLFRVLCLYAFRFSEFFIYVTYDLEGSYGADLRAREFGLVNCSRRLVSLK